MRKEWQSTQVPSRRSKSIGTENRLSTILGTKLILLSKQIFLPRLNHNIQRQENRRRATECQNSRWASQNSLYTAILCSLAVETTVSRQAYWFFLLVCIFSPISPASTKHPSSQSTSFDNHNRLLFSSQKFPYLLSLSSQHLYSPHFSTFYLSSPSSALYPSLSLSHPQNHTPWASPQPHFKAKQNINQTRLLPRSASPFHLQRQVLSWIHQNFCVY